MPLARFNPSPRTSAVARRWLCRAAAVALAAGTAAAQPTQPGPGAAEPQVALELQPTYRLPFSESGTNVISAAFAPDGSTAYIHLWVNAINLWPLAASYWPEIGGGLAGLAVLILGIAAVRVRRDPQRRGVPICRRCHYDLSAHAAVKGCGWRTRAVATAPAARCPECGGELKRRRPRIGRSAARRLAGPLAMAAVVVGAYALMFAGRVPRDGRVSEWFNWPSAWLAQTAGWHKIAWLSHHVYTVDRVVEFDLATGRIRRTVCTRGSRTFRAMTISPDGSWIFLDGRGRRAVDRISTRTGRLIDSASVPSTVVSSTWLGDGPVVFGFSPDGATAYFQVAEDRAAATIVFGWHLASGRVEEVVRTASYVQPPSSGRRGVWPRQYFLRGGGSAVRFVSAPNPMEARTTGRYELRLQEPGHPERKLTVVQSRSPAGTLALTPDGRRLFLTYGRGDAVHGLDLDTGKDLDPLAVSAPTRGHLAISDDGSFLIVPALDSSLLVRDLEHGHWLARLRYPSDLLYPKPTLSANGRWLAAVCQLHAGSRPTPGGHVMELVLYDLGPVRAAQQRTGSPDHEDPAAAAPAGPPRP